MRLTVVVKEEVYSDSCLRYLLRRRKNVSMIKILSMCQADVNHFTYMLLRSPHVTPMS